VESLGRQHDAGQADQVGLLGGIETRRHQRDQPGRGHPKGGEQDGQEQQDKIGRHAEGFPRPVLLAALQVPVEDGDEDDGQGAARQEVVKKVGQGEGGEVDVGRRPAAQHPADDGFSHQPDQPREQNGTAPDHGRDGDAAGQSALLRRGGGGRAGSGSWLDNSCFDRHLT